MSPQVSRRNFLTQKLSRSERDYALPRLTIDQFAREVGVTPEEVTMWLGGLLHRKTIQHAQWSRWTNDTEPIPPVVLRLFLFQRLEEQRMTPPSPPLRPVAQAPGPKKTPLNSGKRGA